MLPLKGLSVVAIEQAVAAPFCTSRLADAGATVWKVERPEGDFARGYDASAQGESSYFVWLNRGKQSVVIDLSQEDGRNQLQHLIAKADVVVQNLKPGSLARLGFGAEKLVAANPRLIVCSITGYGDEGPLADRKAYDLLVQAETGLASITGDASGPSRVGISVVDIATGATAHAAILEALIARSISGKGADIRISMFDVMADWLTVPLLNAESGHPPQRMGLAHPSISPYGAFKSAGGKNVLISIQNEREWRRLCLEVLDAPNLLSESRLATNVKRVANRDLTDRVVGEIFASLAHDLLLSRLAKADIAFAEVNDLASLSSHVHLRRITVDLPKGSIAYPAPAMVVMNEPRTYGAVPGIGDHTHLALAHRNKPEI